jgi:hypothetical protein
MHINALLSSLVGESVVVFIFGRSQSTSRLGVRPSNPSLRERKPTKSVKKYISEGPEKVGVRVVHLEDLARVVIYINIVRNDETLLT